MERANKNGEEKWGKENAKREMENKSKVERGVMKFLILGLCLV